MKSILAVLFALAVGSQALYPPPVVPAVHYGVPSLQVVEPTSAPAQPVPEQVVVAKPVEYSYSYSIPYSSAPAPEVPAPAQPQASASPAIVEQGSVQPPFVSVESVPNYNGIHIPYPYSVSPIALPHAFYPPTTSVDLAHSYIAPAPFYNAPSTSYSYTALPDAPVSVVYGSSGYVNGIPVNGIPYYYPGAAVNNIPLFPTIPAPEIFPAVDSNVSPLFQLFNSSYSYTIPFASVQVAQVSDVSKPAEEKPEKNAEQEVQAVVSEIVLPQKPAVISYEYGIPNAPEVVVQEVKPVVPHTEYGVPLL